MAAAGIADHGLRARQQGHARGVRGPACGADRACPTRDHGEAAKRRFVDQGCVFLYEEDAVTTRKLTPGEITSSVEKIRKAIRRIHQQVLQAELPARRHSKRATSRHCRAKVDISSFLLAEISAIQELIAREEQRVQLGPVRAGGEGAELRRQGAGREPRAHRQVPGRPVPRRRG